MLYYTGSRGLSGSVTPTYVSDGSAPVYVANVDVSDDGRYAVYGVGNVIHFVDPTTGNVLWNSSSIFYGNVKDVRLSGDGSTVLACVDTEGGPVLAIFRNAPSYAGSINVPPSLTVNLPGGVPIIIDSDRDCSKIAVATYEGVHVLDGDGNLLWSYNIPLGSLVSNMEVSEDGKCLVLSDYQGLGTVYYFSLVEPFVGGELEVGGATVPLWAALLASLGVLGIALAAMRRW